MRFQRLLKFSIISIILAAAFLMMSTDACAKSYHLTLLAVSQEGETLKGGTADLSLDVKSGTGKVYLETVPLSQLDTQMSTRFANSVACSFLNEDCTRYDFFYSIRADSPIIGGPSAGGAMAVITVAALKHLDLNQSIAMTGTINSGGAIGPVGGIVEKIDAAGQYKISKVLIPKGERFVDNPKNQTAELVRIGNLTINVSTSNSSNQKLDLLAYGQQKGIDVREVADLNDAVYEFTGKKIKNYEGELVIDKRYAETMQKISDALCERNENILRNMSVVSANNDLFNLSEANDQIDIARNLSSFAKAANASGNYYSAASYCYGSNIKLRYAYYLYTNPDNAYILSEQDLLNSSSIAFRNTINTANITTLTDLQAQIIVLDRIDEATTYFSKINISDSELARKDNLYYLAYAQERLYSAHIWAIFLGSEMSGNVKISKEELRLSCVNKIAEAEERINYVRSIFNDAQILSGESIRKAQADSANEDFGLCLLHASQAKAQADMILNALGLTDSTMKDFVQTKLLIVKNKIIEEQAKGRFPILGYSYYEYANSLIDDDIYSSMIYSEEALELSNIDVYFKANNTVSTPDYTWLSVGLIFLIGLAVGLVCGYVIWKDVGKIRRKNSKLRRKR